MTIGWMELIICLILIAIIVVASTNRAKRRQNGKKISPRQAEPPSSVAEHTEAIRMLNQMISEDIDISVDWDKLQESVAIGKRHAEMIKRRGNPLIPGLIQALSCADARIREKSCWSLQILGSESGLPEDALLAMANLIQDNEQKVRQQVFYSFSALGSKVKLAAILPQLAAALKSTDWNVRKSTAEILGKIGTDSASVLVLLQPLLHDQNVDVVEAAKTAILKLGGKVEAPAAGSLEEMERLVGLTTSADYDVKKKAWADLEKATNHENAVAPLMNAFRKHGGKAMGDNLPKFLGKVGTEASRTALLEMRAYALQSNDAWEQKYLAGSACAALLTMNGGVPALRSVMPAETLRSVITSGLMAAYERERSAIAATLTPEERRETIEEVIAIFRSSADKSNYPSVSGALGSLGTEAVEALLEVLRNVKPSTLQPDGSVKEGDKGEDGAPAAALVRIPGGLDKIKAICPAEEYEKILVRAHEYGAASNPELNRALGEIGTTKAIGRLIFALKQYHWENEWRKPAREALVTTGEKAHEQLLKALEITTPANREFQTNIRKEVLAVLSESGDEVCIAGIQSVLASDPAVVEDAKAALAAIGKRCGIGQAAEIKAAQSLPLKKIAMTGDAYIDDCFQIDFEEMYEERDWFKMPEAKIIPDTANAGQVEQALRLAEELRDKYPDFYFSYYWLAVLYRKQKRHNDGRKTLLEGLKFARSKQGLCSALGDLEWEQKNLSEAVKWWIKSVAVQVGSQYVTDFPSFLSLSYVAEGLGIGLACSELRDWVDRLRSGQLRLNGQAANEFYAATRSQATPAMRLAIEMLEKQYLSQREE